MIRYAACTNEGSVRTTPVTMFPGCTTRHRAFVVRFGFFVPSSPAAELWSLASVPTDEIPIPRNRFSSARANKSSASLLCAYAARAPYLRRSNARSSNASPSQNSCSLLHTKTTRAGAAGSSSPAFLSAGMSASDSNAGAR